jgi:hypothetical protein
LPGCTVEASAARGLRTAGIALARAGALTGYTGVRAALRWPGAGHVAVLTLREQALILDALAVAAGVARAAARFAERQAGGPAGTGRAAGRGRTRAAAAARTAPAARSAAAARRVARRASHLVSPAARIASATAFARSAGLAATARSAAAAAGGILVHVRGRRAGRAEDDCEGDRTKHREGTPHRARVSFGVDSLQPKCQAPRVLPANRARARELWV